MPVSATIALVEDDPETVECVCDGFALHHIDVTPCACVDGVVEVVCGLHPKIVILDTHLPGQDAVAIFRQLRANPQCSGMWVVFFSADSAAIHRQLPAPELVHALVVDKPEVDHLVIRVRQLLAETYY